MMTAQELVSVLVRLPPETLMFFEDGDGNPIPITTVTLQSLYLYRGRDEDNHPVYKFLDGAVVWNE